MRKPIRVSFEELIALILFTFSILYRVLLVLSGSYPPGPDVGLHNSIINSIILHGDFLRNHYHMGSGYSLTHPSFHIFTSSIILATGIPGYMAQPLVAILFSSLMVLCAFLLTRRAWNMPIAPLIAAFMVVLSRYDLEMLLWGGYPNVVALTIISALFYLFLMEDVSTKMSITLISVLTGVLIFTHSLSTLVYVCIVLPLILLELLFSIKSPNTKNRRFPAKLALSISLGFIISLPFVIKVLPAYLENIKMGMFVGGIEENKEATILTRIVPIPLVLASLIPGFSFIAFSKRYSDPLFLRVSLLFCLWTIVPALATQSFIFGLYTDFFRLMHFIVMPVLIFLAIFADHGIVFISRGVKFFVKPENVKKVQCILSLILTTLILLIVPFSSLPLFAGPNSGFTIANYYRVVSPSEFQSIQWIKEKTLADAIFVSEHGYGWWVSGFGERPTLSGTDPQFLIIPHEFEAARIARTLLDSNFILDNGLIEVRDDGGYFARYNPMLFVKSGNSIDPTQILYLNDSEITVFYNAGQKPKIIDISAVPLKDIYTKETSESVEILMTRNSSDLSITKNIRVIKDSEFCNLSIIIQPYDDVSVDYVRFIVHVNGKMLQFGHTVGILNEGAGVCGQIIFEDSIPTVRRFTDSQCVELIYNIGSSGSIEINLAMGGFVTKGMDEKYIYNALTNMTYAQPKITSENASVRFFDYKKVMLEREISFIAFKRSGYSLEKFLKDPAFQLVFLNDKVAIFKVRTSALEEGNIGQNYD